MPLKGIPSVISPDLLRALALMGHGDEIAIVDASFPATYLHDGSTNKILLRADGHSALIMLDAILQLIELDMYVKHPISIIDYRESTNKHERRIPTIWHEYANIISIHGKIPANKFFDHVSYVTRADFYHKAKKAFIILQTGDTSKYSNIILMNGIIGS